MKNYIPTWKAIKHFLLMRIDFLWRFRICMFFNYNYDPGLDLIIHKICDDLTDKHNDPVFAKLKGDTINIYFETFEFTIENNDFMFTAWNSNKYYAWINKGVYTNKRTAKSYSWSDVRPSVRAMVRLKTSIKKHQVAMIKNML